MTQQRLKILFVEDNPGDVLLLNEVLKREQLSFELVNVPELRAAVDILSKDSFDLILLDLSLPDSQGVDTILEVKQHSYDTPIIVLTGTNDEYSGMKAIQAGAQDYLIKGEVDGKVLIRSIRYARERHRLIIELEQARKKELKISEERYRAIVEDQTELIGRFSSERKISFVNGAFCRYFKGSAESFTGLDFIMFIPAESRSAVTDGMSRLDKGEQLIVHECCYQSEPDDEKKWIEWTCRAIIDEFMITREYQAVGLDITDRKLAENELQRINDNLEILIRDRTYELAYTNTKLQKEISQRKFAEESLESEKERLAVTLRSIGEGVIAVDNHMNVTLINLMAEAIIGLAIENVVGRSLDEVFSVVNANTRQKIENPALLSIEKGELLVYGNQTIIITQDKSEIYASLTCAPIRDKNNRIIGAILAFRDMTDQKKLEEELLKISKLESLSLLASGIAHDFNNFLTGIVGNISLGKMLTDSDTEIFKILTNAEDIAFQAKELTVQLLTFAKGSTPHKKVTNIGDLLKNSINFMSRGSKVRCDFQIQADLMNVEVDESQINQVVSNLVINSIQAMPEGGTIFVSADNVTLYGKKLPLAPGKYVRIVFTDTGSGIDEPHISKIFDPYFTTKPKGNGLGLASVYSIIKNHNGLITVESRLNEGASFEIYLPASLQQVPEVGAEAVIEKDKQRKYNGKILIMDDEELIRSITTQLLSHLGFDVQTSSDGREAVEIYKKAMQDGVAFDVIITDLTVPGGMGGIETIENILKIDPNVKAIAASGYFSGQSKLDNVQELGFREYISKPFKINELTRIIQKLIDSGK